LTLSTKCHYAECRDYLNVMLHVLRMNVAMLNVVMLSVVAQNQQLNRMWASVVNNFTCVIADTVQ